MFGLALFEYYLVLFSLNKSSSVGLTHKIGFLIHMALTKDQQTALKLGWRPSSENFISKSSHFRMEKMEAHNGHTSGYMPFLKARI